ncbi:ATP phosphoribosyltransferase [Hymenobacter busanensis]|uniref:ATP phosphoribosyltransferase n=1 Tax=Hymenobacter busanensis TaxID=2607656 RepID=A0A7L4ZST4_9BACT|nr:ATP phosphoribosyltransferase [Hymenobacter busanensis]KAA9339848.1 ATP phosphoribosyltransferase [Hymenobacter busanensis]QHJ06399.1 ATP phosphoribosyltransferase [Hymenobacter busanensis]
MIRLAIQKSGRLSEDSLSLIRECGIGFLSSTFKLKTEATNFPLEILFLRDDDIPGYVQDGVADLGIVGQNVLVEAGLTSLQVEALGFSKCRLSLAVPRGEAYNSVADLQGKNIATSYPQLLGSYLAGQGVQAQLHTISGSVEIAPSIGLADAICDIVSSGSTLLGNGLREVETVFRSEAVLIANQQLAPEKRELLEQLQFRMQAVRRARRNKYILLNAPVSALDAVKALLPGIKSPTVTPLAEAGWVSVQSVVNEDDFWHITDRLKAVGAEGILVLPIEKMIS